MRSVAVYLSDMINATDLVRKFVAGYDFDSFFNDDKTISAVVFQLHVLGEAAKHVPDSVRTQFPDIPWRQMAGTRDRIAHAYFDVDVSLVWDVACNHLPKLRPQLVTVWNELKSAENGND